MAGGRPATVGRPSTGARGLAATGPFDGTTTYGTSYIPKSLLPHEMARPATAYCESCDDGPDCQDV